MLPQEIFLLLLRIASEAILGQKQSHSSSIHHMAHGVVYPILAVHVCFC